MKQKIFAPFDSKLQVWMTPMFFQHSGQAERLWKDLCNEPNSTLSKYPQDFTLYQIGEYDDETAQLTSLAAPVQLMSASGALVDNSPVSRVN